MTNNMYSPQRRHIRGRSEAAEAHQARLSALRQENKSRIAEWLRGSDYSTIAEIAEGTGLSKPTVKERLTDLELSGVVREVAKLTPQEQGSGRPASRYSFDADSVYVVGIEMGKSSERVTFANLGGQIVLRDDREVDPTAKADTRLEGLIAYLNDLKSTSPRPLGRMVGLGVALPGAISRDNRLKGSASFPEWDSVDVAARFGEHFPVPIHLEQDLGAASVAESRMGSAQERKDFVLADVEPDVAASLFVAGEVYRGSHGLAGELSRLESSQQSASTAGGWGSGSDLAKMVAAAEAGDQAALDATKKFAAHAGEQLASLIVTMDPEVLYLHGPVTEMPLLVDLVRQDIPTRIGEASNVTVELSTLGQDGPVFGVTLLALAKATAQLVGATAAPPRYLYTEVAPEASQLSQERTS